MSSDPSYPQDRPPGPPPSQVAAQPPPYAGPSQPASSSQSGGCQPYAPGSDGRIEFQPAGATVEHPKATLAFVLGLLSMLGLLILGPFGWYVGRRALREIDQDPRQFSNRGLAMAGMVMGIIGTAFMLLLVVLGVVGIILLVASGPSVR